MNKKLRVLFLITDLYNGGAETMLYHILRFLDRERFEPQVISLMDRGKFGDIFETMGVPVQTIDMQQGRPTPGSFFRLLKLVRAARPDVIQGWMYHANIAAQLASLFVRVPVCWCVHSSFGSYATEKPLTRLMIWLAARVSRRAAKVVFVSHISRTQHEKIGYAAERGCVIPNGVDLAMFQPSAEARASVRAELGLTPSAPLVGMTARYHPQKDHANFLQAAALLARQRPDVHFLLAGFNVNQENATLVGLVKTLGLEGRVHLLGERSDMPRLLASFDLATLSSSFGEAHPLAISEAMACAVPCVVTNVGDGALVVGETGAVVPPSDPAALAGGWARILADGGTARALGQAARRRTEENYSVAAVVRSYEELFVSLK
ncbi:MAG: glycosyltransferase [Chthoniobacter sp.]|nr:glycosyltransferase [Chthoniobacter sp.]